MGCIILDMKIFSLALCFALSVSTAISSATGADVPTWQKLARQEFGGQRFGIFVHWGVYATYAQGEWYQSGAIPRKVYARAANAFYPSRYDARKWARTFKEAGARYVTFTTRHHDGFSMFETKYAEGDYDIMHTPFKRDVTRELADACHAEGLQINFYYSLMDWWRSDYPLGKSLSYIVDKEVNANADYASYHRFMLNQLGELLTNYGRIGCIWLDGEGDHRDGTPEAIPGGWRFDELYDFIHAHGALVGNNNNRPVREKEDIQFFEMTNDATIKGARANRTDKPFERCFTMQKGIWGYQVPCNCLYKADGKEVRVKRGEFYTSAEMIRLLVRNAAKGVNLLLNVGPCADGDLQDESYVILADMGKWLKVNGEAIYGTQAGPVAEEDKVVSTQTEDALYVHFLDPSVKEFTFKSSREIVSVTAVDGGGDVPHEVAGESMTLRPAFAADAAVTVVKIVYKR